MDFFLSIVITLSIMLCIYACITVWSSSRRKLKYTFTYLSLLLLSYQLSTILALYSPTEVFRGFVNAKTISAFLLKSAFLYYIAVNINNRTLERAFYILHLISYSTAVPYFLYKPYSASIIEIAASSHTAVYGPGAQIYAIVSNIIYIAAAIAFIISYKPLREVRRYYVFLILFITVNVALLSIYTFSSKDALHEQTHILILSVYLAFFLRYTPFWGKNDRLLSPANILTGVGEAILIMDEQGKAIFCHNGFDGIDVGLKIDDIGRVIAKDNGMNQIKRYPGEVEDLSCFEGEMEFMLKKRLKLHYSVSPLFLKNSYMGRIIVLRDITLYDTLLQELNEKNTLLTEALERQKEYVKTAQKLAVEEERSKVLATVNNIAGEFLKKMKLQIERLESEAFVGGIAVKEIICSENEKMLDMTRKTISEVRQSVAKLHEISRWEE